MEEDNLTTQELYEKIIHANNMIMKWEKEKAILYLRLREQMKTENHSMETHLNYTMVGLQK